MAVATPRRRPRRGSLERPVSGRIYRAAWIAVAVPVLVAAFSVGRPVALQQPRLPPSFDRTTAVQFTRELAGEHPVRSPGTAGAVGAADFVAAQLRSYRFTVERQPFTAEVPGRGRERFENIVAVAPVRPQDTAARSNETIVVMAHRDNLGAWPGANNNASGTAALLELARNIGTAAVAHTIVFVSTDGGVYGGLGAEEFARSSDYADRTIAVINLDAIAGRGSPRVEFAGDTSRSPASPLIATAEASILAQTQNAPERPGAGAQLIDLAFPFTLYEQGPFIARGTPAVTITTGGVRPDPSAGDTIASLDAASLDELGRSAQALLGSLDTAAEVTRGTESYIYVGSRLIRGWTVQFILLAALLPFLAATVDLFARCRRRHIALGPALRSFVSRLGVWAWAGLVFAFFTFAGLLPSGASRPIALDTPVAGDWPVLVLIVFTSLTTLGWLVARPQLVRRSEVARSDELGGHLAAMLVLGLVALVVAAQNPYALIFVLPSLHAWLWLPHVVDRLEARLLVYALGFAGPLLLLGSFALRFELGFDAPWYLLALAAVGYIPLPLMLAFLAWGAVATQVGALAAGRYAPYPAREDRPERGPIRESVRQLVLLTRRTRAPERRLHAVESPEEAEELREG
jgi:hypothetical protein